ncbi:MAG: Hsp20/alpha crystallin family protein [Verrucomicrobiota bacterium]
MSTALTRWDPFRELEEMHNRLSGFFSRTPARRSDGNEALITADWSPAVDIVEDEREYLIKAELPEVKKDEVKVTVENGALMISGERKLEKEQKGRKYHRVERAYGSFGRSFLLPDDADTGRIRAEFSNGVLQVHVAKTEAGKPKPIEVKVN